MAAPNQDQRKKCWDARDLFWKCLDDNNGNRTKCEKPQKLFKENCSKTWVKYFDRRYDYLKFKDRMEKEGYEPVSSQSQSQS